jgi:hypothetical protein
VRGGVLRRKIIINCAKIILDHGGDDDDDESRVKKLKRWKIDEYS